IPSRSRTSSSAMTTEAPVTVGESLRGGLPTGQSRCFTMREVTRAPAIRSGHADERLQWLADEQAAPRRRATLVPQGASVSQVAKAVVDEVVVVLGLAMGTLDRYEGGGSIVLASLNDPGFPVGSRWKHDGPSLGKTVLETGRPARIDDYTGLA